MTSNIIYLSSGDEGEDIQMVSTKSVRSQGSPKIMGAVSSTDIDRDEVTEPQQDLSAPVASIPEQRAPMLGPKPKSFDLGGSQPRSGLAMVRAASAPHGGLSATTVSNLHRAANIRAAASFMGTKLPLAFAFPTRPTPSKAIDATSNIPAADPVKHFNHGTQAISLLATRSKSGEEHTSAATEHLSANEILPATPAADSVFPQVVSSASLTDPFASRASKTVKNAPKKSAVSQNAFSKSASKRGASSTADTLNEPLGKRQRVEAQPDISTLAPYTSTPPNFKRLLWTIPMYNPANDPARQTAPTTEPAAVSTNAPPPTPRPAFTRLFESTKDLPKTFPGAKKDEATKAPVAPKASPRKTKLPPPAKLSLPRNQPTAQAAPLNAADDAPGAPHLPTIMVTPPTPTATAFAPSSAPPRTKTKPWTSREYAELAQVAYHSFPFAVFAATHGKTEAEVMKMYSAIIQLPIFNHSAKGLAKARLKEQERAEEETREAHRAEERRGGGGRGKREVGGRAEDAIALLRSRRGAGGRG